jgi:hypothetical protein
MQQNMKKIFKIAKTKIKDGEWEQKPNLTVRVEGF